jgi:putative oxidoreductase
MESILHNTSKWLSSLQQSTTHHLARLGGLDGLCVMTARALLGLFFIYFGLDKFVNYSDTGVYMSAFGVPAFFLPVVILLEIIGGIALLVGWQIKRMAGLLAGFTALTALIFHSDFAEPVQVILFMKNMAITGGLLLFIAIGAGQLSIDAQIANKNKKVKKSR